MLFVFVETRAANMNLEFIDKVGGHMEITLKIEVCFTS